MPAKPHHVPRLTFDVTHNPRHHHHQHHQTHRHPDHAHHHHHHQQQQHHHDVKYKQHDVKYRRAALDPDYIHHSSRGQVQVIREQTLSSRNTAYGFDRDYLQEYYVNAGGEYHHPAARAQLYTHDSSDPFSCTCYPRVSQKTIPSMMYDQVRCPHPDHRYQPGEQDLFTYPWTSQTYRPHVVFEHGYRPGQIKPPSAVTAPPFVLYNPPEPNPRKGKHSHLQPQPPYSAPEKPLQAPLMPVNPSDRRLRRVNRHRVAPATAATTALPNLPEEDDEGGEEAEDVYPFDSISQQRATPLRSFRPPSLRLRTVDTPVMGRVESEMRARTGMRALSTPRALPPLDADGFPQTPTRIFKGEYVDTKGQKYQYDIKYGKTILDGKRTRLETL